MEKTDGLARCDGCGGRFPSVAGPVHRYIESSPGCWAAYGEVLAREYGDRAYYGAHRLSVDAYAVQHPGQSSPQSIRSVAIHLISLCLVLERGFGMDQATVAKQEMARTKEHYRWLEPPPSRGRLTVLNLHEAKSAQAHAVGARAWARDTWEAWAAHHGTIRGWVDTHVAQLSPR